MPCPVAQLFGVSSYTLKGGRFILGQSTNLGWGFDPQSGYRQEATDQWFYLTLKFLSLFLYSSVSLKSINWGKDCKKWGGPWIVLSYLLDSIIYLNSEITQYKPSYPFLVSQDCPQQNMSKSISRPYQWALARLGRVRGVSFVKWRKKWFQQWVDVRLWKWFPGTLYALSPTHFPAPERLTV